MAYNRIVNGKLEKNISVTVEIELTDNDIFNWLNDCLDSRTLRNLARAALSFAKALENPNDDDFRSRA